MDAGTLREFEVFRDLSDRALNGLTGVFSLKKAEVGEKIITQGTASTGVYLMVSGVVEVIRETKSGALIPIHKIKPGVMFGSLSTIDGGFRGAHCIAKESVEYAFMKKNDFIDLIEGNSPLAMSFQVAVIRAIFKDVRDTNAQFAELSALEPLEDMTPLS